MTALLPACIEDSFSTSPSDQPTFSTDTLKLGEVFTAQGTPTHRFIVHNRHDKMMNISYIGFRDDAEGHFRLNVDGISGREFNNVEIRANDSVFVFVETTLPENGSDELIDVKRHIDFVTNGITSTVVVTAQGQDAIRYSDLTLTENTTFTYGRPYLITGKLVVPEGITLTLAEGARLRMHDKAEIVVDGTLRANGTPEKPVQIRGDRDGYVAAQIPYELMSGQWGGIYFAPTSRDNVIINASIRNSSYGLYLDSIAPGTSPALTMVNSQVRNTTSRVLTAYHSDVKLIGCELTEASDGILLLIGGKHIVNHCTIANYYLFTALGAPSIEFSHIDAETDDASGLPFCSAEFTNSIIYGNGTLLSHGDLSGMDVYFRRCLIGVNGTDDDNFIDVIWDEDPMFYTVRQEYLFDYRLKPESPAIGAAFDTYDIYGLTNDRYGAAITSPSDLGALKFVAPTE